MPLLYEQFIKRLALMTDPDLLCDVLDITSEDLLERFGDIVEDRIELLQEIYDVDVLGIDEEDDTYD